MTFNILMLTGEQIRAARALSRTEQNELARLSGLSLETIKRLERIRGPVNANARTLRAIQDAFESLGVQFDGDDLGNVGVRRRCSEPRLVEVAGRPPDTEPAPRLHRLVYQSRIAHDGVESLRPILAYINAEAGILHTSLGLTGIIYVHEGQVLQALEGDRDAVHQAYRAIGCYPQHHSLRLIEDRPTSRRQFTGFSFCCGMFPEDFARMDGDQALPSGFNIADLTPGAASDLLGVARDLQQTAPRRTRGNPGACTLASTCLDSTCGRARTAPGHHNTPQAH